MDGSHSGSASARIARNSKLFIPPVSAGDIIYYPGYASGLVKVAIAYGQAQWLAPFMVPLDVTYLGRLDTNVDAFVQRCQRIIFDGPLHLEISRAE